MNSFTSSQTNGLPALPQLQIPQTAKPGGFWKRFLAVLIDSIIHLFIFFPLIFVLRLLIAWVDRNASGIDFGLFSAYSLSPILRYPLSWGIGICYYGWFYKHKGATPGKMALGLKVIDFQTGENLDYGKTILREILGKTLSGLILMIGFIMAGFRQDKRALHDLIANTQVIEVIR